MEIPADQLSEAQKELSKILRKIKLDVTRITWLGGDGVFRSFTEPREVIDALPFSPNLIKALLDRMPFEQETENAFRGVDGRNMPQEQWCCPAKSDVPDPLMKEEEEEAKKLIEVKGVERWQEKEEERRNSEGPHCPVTIVLNYNLEVKLEESR